MLLVWSMIRLEPMTNVEFPAAIVAGAALLVAGYLGPSIKEIFISKDGMGVRTHDPKAESRDQLEEMSEEARSGEFDVRVDEVRSAAATGVVQDAFGAMFETAVGYECSVSVYLYDDEKGGLAAFFTNREDILGQPAWRPGQGAVGVAWQRGELVLVHGEAATDGTYGLDAELQQAHTGLRAVMAVPIVRDGQVAAVLALSERGDAEPPWLTTSDAREQLVGNADKIAILLADVLRAI
jgi:GAF domain-containing protein